MQRWTQAVALSTHRSCCRCMRYAVQFYVCDSIYVWKQPLRSFREYIWCYMPKEKPYLTPRCQIQFYLRFGECFRRKHGVFLTLRAARRLEYITKTLLANDSRLHIWLAWTVAVNNSFSCVSVSGCWWRAYEFMICWFSIWLILQCLFNEFYVLEGSSNCILLILNRF